MRSTFAALLLAVFSVPSVAAQSAQEAWNGLPDRFQIDTGYFRLSANTVLRYQGPEGGSGEVDLESDLGLEEKVNTLWVDGTWRVGRRHQLKLAYTRVQRDRPGFELRRDFTWGGETYQAGLVATSTAGNEILGGYYRFAAYRNERFEIGPTLGIGYLWLDARIRATGTVTGPSGSENRTLDEAASTGSVTGAIGGYVGGWPAKRLNLQGDFLYLKATPEGSEASVTDWRLAAYYYVFKNVGVAAQYKYYRYRYDRAAVSSELGGEITAEGFQLFVSFRF